MSVEAKIIICCKKMSQLSRFSEAHFQGAVARLKSAPNSDVRARAQHSFSQI